MVRPSTRALIEDAQRYSAKYRGGFANHLPMALVALDAMGATDAEAARFARTYEALLEPIGEAEVLRVREIERRISEQGLEAVFAAHAPALATGFGSAAFHGAIRMAYALESGSDAEVAHALNYWLTALAPLPELPMPMGNDSPAEVLRAISLDPARAAGRPSGGNIAARMAQGVREAWFPAHVARLNPACLHVDALAEPLIYAYAATGDFTLLHGVTGCHAFGKLLPLFPNEFHAACCVWTAIAAAYVASGSPLVEGFALEGDDTRSWPEIHRLAAQCDDEHDVKLAYSCWREWQRSGDDLYRRAASARVSKAVMAKETVD